MNNEFANLSQKDQQKVQNLINKLANKAGREESNREEATGKQDRIIRRPPASQVKKVSQQGTPAQKIGRKPKVNQQPLHTALGTVDVNRAINAPGRPNFFEEQPTLVIGSKGWNAHKNDTVIDQKLSGSNDITNRGERQALVEVSCNHCGQLWEVSPKLVHSAPDGIRFICEQCQRRRQ